MVLSILASLIAVPLALFLWGAFYYWTPSCSSSLHSGLLGAALGVAVTGVLAFIAYYQFSDIAKTNTTDFIHRLKNDDPDGFVDQEKLDENIRLILNIRGGAGVKREGPVLNINHRRYERRFKAEYRWMPTGEEWRGLEIRINSLISPE